MIRASAGQRLGQLLLEQHADTHLSHRSSQCFFTTALALLLLTSHGRLGRGFPLARTGVSSGHIRMPEGDSMLRAHSLPIVPVSALLLASAQAAVAQTAVEWRVADGGNGHWYATADAPTGDDAIALAASLGGHLATVADAAENAHIKSLYLATGKQWAWLGLRQRSGQTTPSAGWYWITGEPSTYLNWSDHNGVFPSGAPDDSPCALPPWAVENDQANQGVMQYDGRWDDLETGMPTCGSPVWDNTAIIEWDADCDGDGTVDYGQIARGELPDVDGNGVPDCCDKGIPCGPNLLTNGSFESGPAQACGWICVGVGAAEIPGWSVTLNSVDRQRTAPPDCLPEGWIASDGEYSIDLNGCSVGGRIDQSIPTLVGRRYAIVVELTVNPGWDRGELRVHAGLQSFDFTAFRIKAPIQPWTRMVAEFVATTGTTVIGFESLNREYPAQWAGPVIDDARVILLPQAPCPGDVTGDRRIDGVDLAAVLAAWGSNGTGQFDTDTNDDGVVDGVDLATILGAWGACP
jgi:hypothetical protein